MNRKPLAPALHSLLAVLALLALVLFAGLLVAQANPEELVRITVQGGPGARTLSVRPRAIGICRNPNADCGNEVTWRANSLRDGETVRITKKSDSPSCFASDTFTLSGSPPEAKSGSALAACSDHVLWLYDVTLTAPGQDPVVIDPAVVIDP